jgi:hypothetical protein
MGSFSRLYARLAARGVSKHDLTDVTYAIEKLESAGDDLSDILFPWYDGRQTKDEVVDKARLHLLELSKCVDRIAISR